MPLLNKDGEFSGYRGVSSNITEQKLAETQQQINEHRYRRLYNDTPVMMHSLDRNGTICDVNDHWLKTLGYERGEVIGRRAREFHTESSRERLLQVLPQFFEDGYCKDIPYQLRKKNGQVIDVLISANGFKDSAGNFIRSDATMIDVTIQKRYDTLSEIHETLLKESERKYRAIIKSAADAIFVVDITNDPYGRLIDVNQTACESLGYSKDELLTMTVADIEVKLDTSKEGLRNYKSPPGEVTTLYGAQRRKDGSEFPVSVRTRAIKYDDHYILVAVARDETENLSYQEALEEAKTRAESALAEAEQASRAKSDFLANMSHELRTPLNAINGFSETLEILNQKGMLSTEKASEYLDYIKGSSKHLLGLINDLLDYLAIEAGKLELNRVLTNVDELVEESVLMLAKRIDDNNQTLNVSVETDLPDIMVDQLRIKQVLVNLLTNASKFTPEGGSIAVRAAMGSHANLNITTKDSGQGMDEEEIQIALERFGRANSSAGHEGTGLGLPLSRELILAHDGQMNIESRPGLGTTVTVSLPVNGRSGSATDSSGESDSIPNWDI